MSEQAPADPHTAEQFDNPITVIEAEARFRAAGLPRHTKSIERYCRVGSLRCKKEYGANGFQYLIEATPADELIEFLKQAHNIGNAVEHAPASYASHGGWHCGSGLDDWRPTRRGTDRRVPRPHSYCP
jgi:hypothetical protein